MGDKNRWIVQQVQLIQAGEVHELLDGALAGPCDIPSGLPFLIRSDGKCDGLINAFFESPLMRVCAENTNLAYAHDVATFLTFVDLRGCRDWRNITVEDHMAYFEWRTRNPDGPKIAASSWDRSVAGVNAFFHWQVEAGNITSSPIPQRLSRPNIHRGRSGGVMIPATRSHRGGTKRVRWLTPKEYKDWRDAGVRGLPGSNQLRRGSRNALYTDLMVRTGLRVTEQSLLMVHEIGLEQRAAAAEFWLPESIAKGGSARQVYIPRHLIRELRAYVDIDRQESIQRAAQAGRYSGSAWIVKPRPVTLADKARISRFSPSQRLRLLLMAPDGTRSPAALWLTQDGLPMGASSWKRVFQKSCERSAREGLPLHVHPHMLRHTFAVMTLNRLQQGIVNDLVREGRDVDDETLRLFGDPVNWLRILLGHRSIETTMVYIGCIAELELATRLALLGDWETAPSIPAGETANV